VQRIQGRTPLLAPTRGKDARNPGPWQLPAVLVMRFNTPPPLKRIYPFDTGAFHRGRMPDYLTAFDMENFELGSDQDQIGRMISLYFQDARSHAASLWLPTKNIENNPMQSSRRSPAGTLWANT